MGFIEACFALATGFLGIALPPSTAPSSLINNYFIPKKQNKPRTHHVCLYNNNNRLMFSNFIASAYSQFNLEHAATEEAKEMDERTT